MADGEMKQVLADQMRNGGFSEEAIKASLAALSKTLPPRMLTIEQRAVALGCEVERCTSSGLVEVWLHITIRNASAERTIIGSLSYWPAARSRGGTEIEEQFDLQATAKVLTGLPMQADWLLENARRVREVFNALVAQ